MSTAWVAAWLFSVAGLLFIDRAATSAYEAFGGLLVALAILQAGHAGRLDERKTKRGPR